MKKNYLNPYRLPGLVNTKLWWGVLAFAIILWGRSAIAEPSDTMFYGILIKEINITGLKHTKEYIVIRELASKINKPYTEETAKLDYVHLEKLGIFSDIQFHPRREGDQIILEIVLKETFPFLPTIGFMVTEENGVSAGAGVETINFLGRAINTNIFFLLGGLKTVGIGLQDPWVFGNHAGYRARYFYNVRDNKVVDFREDAHEFYFDFMSWIREQGRFLIRAQLLSIGSDRDGATISSTNRDIVPMIGVGLGIDNRDRILNTQRGNWSFIELQKFGIFGWGDTDFWQIILDFGIYFSLAEGHTIHLASLTELRSGILGKEVAPWQTFSLGGTNTIRGHKLNARLGKNEMINTVEYRFTFMEPRPVKLPFGIQWAFGLHLTGFLDFGHAWNSSQEFSFYRDGKLFPGFIAGSGVGIRLLMPFAMLRFDFAWGQPNLGMSFHFGSQEKVESQRERVR